MDKMRIVYKKLVHAIGERALVLREDEQAIFAQIAREDLAEIAQYIYFEHEARIMTMVGNDERPLCGKFALYYVFAIDAHHLQITLRVAIDELDPTFPSLAAYIPALNWYEREVNDLLGLRALGHPNRAPLVSHGHWAEDVYPLRKDFDMAMLEPCQMNEADGFVEYLGEDVTSVPVGPIHAGIIEAGHFRFGTVGDTVLHLDARLFFTHRGIEKSLEGRTFAQALPLIERICCVCTASHSEAFAQCVEKATRTDIPQRAKFLRMLYLELERLYNHVGDVGNICAGYGFAVGNSQGARMRESLLRLNEELTGHRYLRGVIVPGGVKRDIGAEQIDRLRRFLQALDEDFQDLADILLGHEIAVDRMKTTGRLTAAQVRDLGGVGVAARSSGVDIDCRRDFSYEAYDKVSLGVVVHTDGDVLTRIQVRIDEVFNSILLILQILQNLPEGHIYTKIGMAPAQTISMGWSESARGENCHWMMTDADNKIYRYRIRSAAYSNWPLVALAVPGNIVPDFPLINKSFELCYSCCDR